MIQEQVNNTDNPYRSPLEECSAIDSAEFNLSDRSLVWLLFSFKGRISRGTFWLATIGSNMTCGLTLISIMDFFGFRPEGDIKALFGSILMLLLCILWGWSYLAIEAKRWHDRNHSTYWIFLNLVPYLGLLWIFIELGCFPGTEGPNRYGPDPSGGIRVGNINQLRENEPIRGKAVELDGTDATDEVFARLANGWEIEELRLGGTQVTDDGMRAVGKLPNLKVLDLSMTAVTDLGLNHLLNLTNLSDLWLGGTKITDAGLLKLSVMPHLDNIYAINTDITPDGIQQFQSRHSRCNVHY